MEEEQSTEKENREQSVRILIEQRGREDKRTREEKKRKREEEKKIATVILKWGKKNYQT